MSNTSTIEKKQEKTQIRDKEYYNKIPVYYCKHCGSLKIVAIQRNNIEDYCDDCGGTNIGKVSIEGWLKMQETVYKPAKRQVEKLSRKTILNYIKNGEE